MCRSIPVYIFPTILISNNATLFFDVFKFYILNEKREIKT